MTEQEQNLHTYEMPIRFQFLCPLGHMIEGDVIAASWKPRRALCLHGRGHCAVEAQVECHNVEEGTVTFSLAGFCPFMHNGNGDEFWKEYVLPAPPDPEYEPPV